MSVSVSGRYKADRKEACKSVNCVFPDPTVKFSPAEPAKKLNL